MEVELSDDLLENIVVSALKNSIVEIDKYILYNDEHHKGEGSSDYFIPIYSSTYEPECRKLKKIKKHITKTLEWYTIPN